MGDNFHSELMSIRIQGRKCLDVSWMAGISVCNAGIPVPVISRFSYIFGDGNSQTGIF